MYRTMVASPALDVEGLFDLLQDPDRITAEVVAARATQLDGLMAYLAKTLEVDLVVLETCSKRERNSQLQRLLSRPLSTRFG